MDRITTSALAGIAALPLLAAAQIAAAGEAARYSFASDTLGRDYAYTIYTPDGYEDGDLRYPHMYLLHGSFGNETDWLRKGNAKATLDRMIEEGRIPPAVVIMPGSESWWVDGYNEKAETAFFEDLIPHVESTWRVIPEREGRVIGGLSAGGYGTVNFVLEHPDMFAAGAALSPASYVPQPPESSSGNRHPAYLDAEGNYDPAKWTELNYTAHIDDYMAQETVVPLYINSGDHDVFDIAYHAAVLYQALREHQPDAVEFRVVDGDHEWRVWEETLPEALEFVFGHAAFPGGTLPASETDARQENAQGNGQDNTQDNAQGTAQDNGQAAQ
ncbi:alpha/beta hydrolase [Profundibacterium mesophilum]|uniref:Esterase lipase n=1 Tax=Profundibacterium mesophilum KAUST100406-0324 TaxID=1037889 RepID=A0A921NQS9_9RHOB|nr:alpha/beta hydrolase-fold protein [Profundibacterium mesophilum]KAF0675632.1 esterase lipase [Profundibacterium mesophilum KAUST100406-0324]